MRSKKALINIITSVILQIITIICGFIVPKLIIEHYGSATNGLLQSITQFLAYIVLLESGFGPVIKAMLYKPIANKDKETIEKILKTTQNFFRKISYIFIAYILVLCIVLPMATATEFDAGFTISLLLIISISTFAEYFLGMTYKIYIGAEQKQYINSIIQIITLLLNTALVLLLIYFKADIRFVKLTSATVFVLRPILQYAYAKRKYGLNLKNVKGNYPIKQKWDGLAQHIAYVIHKNTDIVIVTLFSDIKDVSVYSIYYIVINSVKNVVQSFADGLDAPFGDMNAKGEQSTLDKSFKMYEVLYFTITTIAFACTAILIIPFVTIYTKGIVDANYIRPEFAYIAVLAEFIFMLRYPYYNILVKGLGKFKETKIGAWVEAIINILISVILVWRYGLIGVAIGTLVAMTIRTIEMMCYTYKEILKRNILGLLKRLLITVIEIVLIFLIMSILPQIQIDGYKDWFIKAIEVFTISTVIVTTTNFAIYRKDVKNIKSMLKGIVSKK